MIHIAVDLPFSPGHFAHMVEGIFEESHRHPNVKLLWRWGLMLEPSLQLYGPGKPDGVLASGYHQLHPDTLEQSDIPSIILSSRPRTYSLPRCCVPNEEVGRTAAQFFLEKGFRHFCAIHRAREAYLERCRAFRQSLPEGTPCPFFDADSESRSALGEWLSDLPTPCAVFLTSDHLGSGVMSVIEETGRTIPDDMALLGVDNAEMLCRICHPPLSSIEGRGHEVGATALRKLIHWITEGTRPEENTAIECGDIIERASSQILIYPDPMVRDALLEILHAEVSPRPEDVAKRIGCSLRTLQRRFKLHRGQTLKQCIDQHRLRRVQTLLRNSPLTLGEIADDCGFSDYFCLANWYKRQTGQTMGGFRNEQGTKPSSHQKIY